MKMNLENFRKNRIEFTLLGAGAMYLVLAIITADMILAMLGCTAFIVMMISAVGKSIVEEIRKNGGARDA